MPQTFKIAESNKIGEYFSVGEKTKVTEQSFWDLVQTKVKELTLQNPEKYEETLQRAITHIQKGSSLTILDKWFQIQGRKI